MVSRVTYHVPHRPGRKQSEHYRLMAALGGNLTIGPDDLRKLAELCAAAERVVAMDDDIREKLARVDAIHALGLRLVANQVRGGLSMGELWLLSGGVALLGGAIVGALW